MTDPLQANLRGGLRAAVVVRNLRLIPLECTDTTGLRSHMSKYHAISRYDKNLCLKPDATIWLIFLFLLRAYVVLILSVVNMSDRMGLINLVYPDRLTMSLGALAGIPAALLAYAWINRRPSAPQYVRNIWGNGRAFLVVSALLNAGVIFVPFWMGTLHTIPAESWAQFAIALLIVIVVYSSSYIRDCFNDFPGEKQ